jgi:xanthine dehydrogenase molybdopterin-binding subunit B
MKNDIEAYCSRICGLPGDTDEVFEKDLKIMAGLRKKYGDKLTIWPTSFRVFPGSYMYDHPEEFGITFSYFPGTDIQSEFFIDGLSRDKVNKRIDRIRTEIPEKPIEHHKSNLKNRFIKRS